LEKPELGEPILVKPHQLNTNTVTAIVPCPEVDGISCPGIAGKNGKLREISTCHFV
jgi:hypothetical protein